MRMPKILIVLIMLALAITACTQASDSTEDMETIDVVLAYSPSMFFTQTPVANAEGMWAEHGLNVEEVTFATGRLALEALLADRADFATVADSPIMLAGFQDHDIAIIADTVRGPKSVIVARRDSGIETAADLAGKDIGTTLGTSVHYSLGLLLAENGLSEADVNVVNVSPPEMVAAISRGDVDAIATWEPNVLVAQRELGDDSVSFELEANFANRGYMVTTHAFADENPEAVERMVATLLDAADYMAANPAESQQFVSDRIQAELDVVQALWSKHEYNLVLDNLEIPQLESQAQWAIDKELAPEGSSLPDYASYFLSGPLAKLEPDAVKME